MKLVECVPNFSEGRDRVKIKIITDAIAGVDGITLLDVDPGRDTNRTVVTFVGSPQAVEAAAFSGIKTAAEIIDMRLHKGAHARLGATDVCPFIPISGITAAECVKLSHRVGERVGRELNIPVYFYEQSARKKDRKNLPAVRQGEYEGLSEKLQDPHWKPDFGPAAFNPGAGATIIGVRDFLIAYNINLNTRDKRLAADIAFELREKGRSVRKPNPDSPNLLDGEIVRYEKDAYPCAYCADIFHDPKTLIQHSANVHEFDLKALWNEHGYKIDNLQGKALKKPGLFKAVKAVGWYMDSFKRAQISINFNNYHVSSIQAVFDAACRLAVERGLRVTGSELVGLVPLSALLSAGRFYLKKQKRSIGVARDMLIETAIQSLGLNDVAVFEPAKKIIEFAVQGKEPDLASKTVRDFIDELSSNSPAPGGGSAAALAGSLGAALGAMTAALSFEKKGLEKFRENFESYGAEAQELKEKLCFLIDEDTKAFKEVINAGRLPAGNTAEKDFKTKAVKKAAERVLEVPLKVARLSFRVMELAQNLVETGNPNSVSDAGSAAELGLAGVRAAALNVFINLPLIEDIHYAQDKRMEIETLLKKALSLQARVFTKTIGVIGN
ncbi:MAG: glutamate formimidoyltransferase [Candidatus Neomarinimicrobiota bacterium]